MSDIKRIVCIVPGDDREGEYKGKGNPDAPAQRAFARFQAVRERRNILIHAKATIVCTARCVKQGDGRQLCYRLKDILKRKSPNALRKHIIKPTTDEIDDQVFDSIALAEKEGFANSEDVLLLVGVLNETEKAAVLKKTAAYAPSNWKVEVIVSSAVFKKSETPVKTSPVRTFRGVVASIFSRLRG